MNTVNDITWKMITPDDVAFWPLVASLLLGLEMRKEIGSCPHVAPSDRWIIGIVDGTVVAISCMRVARRGGVMCHDYVVPDHRRRGYHAHMVEARVAKAREMGLVAIHAVASPSARGGYHRSRFEQVGTRGRFALMRLALRDGLVSLECGRDGKNADAD